MSAVASLAVVQQQNNDTFRSGFMAEVAVVAIVKQQRCDFLRSGNYNSIGSYAAAAK